MSIKSLNRDEINQIFFLLEQRKIHEREKQKKFGNVKPILHANHIDMKFIAVGSVLYRSKKWKTFPDFLFEFVFIIFGKEWYDNENLKNYDEKHEISKWYIKSIEFSKNQIPNEDGLIQANPNGITSAFLLFSYDLYTVLNNSMKIDNLIERLKDKLQFQGARYELFCLASCIRAGFEIELEDEKDSSQKHVEFCIREKGSHLKISVEAKSKHRSGILGQPGEKIADDKLKVGKLTQLINNAITKNVENPLIVFLDFNLPFDYADYVIGGKSFKKIFNIFESVNKTDDGKDFFNLVVLTNHPHHYGMDDKPAPEKIHSLIYSLNPKHKISDKDLFNKLVYASLQFGIIPNNFDDL